MRKSIIAACLGLAVGAAGCIVTSFLGYAVNPTISPKYGNKPHKEIREGARILRDKWGIAHVEADNEYDLFFAVGYAQAQDRLFQMDVYRKLIAGRLAEVFGDQEVKISLQLDPVTMLTQDKIYRIIGFKYLGEVGQAMLKEKSPDTYRLMQAFCDGVNAFIEDSGDKLPLEFRMLDYRPEPFRPANVVALGRFVGWSLASNLEMEITRWALANKFDEQFAREVLPPYRKPVPDIPTILPRDVVDYRKLEPVQKSRQVSKMNTIPASPEPLAKLGEILAADRIRRQIAPFGHASNNWIVSGELTESGMPILANDPHLTHMMPSIFWQVHIKGAGYNVFGVTFPGMPFVVLGHNRHVAWGLTTTRADVQDIYVEKFNSTGNKYKYKDDWEPVTVREEVMKVRDGLRGDVEKAEVLKVKMTRHGPVINDFNPAMLEDAPPMALRWAGYDFSENQELTRLALESSTVEEFMEKFRKRDTGPIHNEVDVIMKMMKAETLDDFKEAMKIHGVPNQNWVAVDDSGNIGYIAGGRIPLRAAGDGAKPVPGWTGEYEWTRFVPPEHVPQVFNPDRGYVATANNQVVPPGDYPYVFGFSYVSGWRAMRVEQLLKEKIRKEEKFTVHDMASIQNDTKMLSAAHQAPQLLDVLEETGNLTFREKAAAKALEDWNYYANYNSPAPAIYTEWLSRMMHLTFEDEMGERMFRLYTQTKLTLGTLEYMIHHGSPYFDNKNTAEKETRDDIMRRAFTEAVAGLTEKLGKKMEKWSWGELHTVTFSHPLGVGPFAKYLNYGPLPHHGGHGTVRAASHKIDDYRTVGGPCLRHVVDMSNVDGSLWIIDGGESGQWKSPHYKDGAEMWYRGQYIKALMDMDEVSQKSEGLFLLKPMPGK